MPSASACPRVQDLEQLLSGLLPDDRAEPLEQHLLACPRCVQTMRSLKVDTKLIDVFQTKSVAQKIPQGPEVENLVQRMRELATPVGDSTTGGDTLPPADPSATGAYKLHGCLAPAQAPDEIGRLGPYRVLKVLGEGGMGMVFAAEDPKLQRLVALKVMKGKLSANPESCERFLREARATAAIEDDHIVAIYQVGEDDGVPFLAMQFLQGETLQSRIEREKTLPLLEVLRIGREIAQGLAAAHERGLIHRDIKPGNIWLEAKAPASQTASPSTKPPGANAPRSPGRVKIVDFGLAHVVKTDVRLTADGHILGTPAFMPPEQAEGINVDARSDLYSLGVVLFYLCTGRLPFPQREILSLLNALVRDPPPQVREINPKVPAPLADLIMRLLAKKPADRLPSAQAVVEVIQAIEQGATPPKLLQPKPRRWWPMAAAVLLGALGLAGYLYGPVVYRIATNKGELVITTDDPDVEVVVKQGGQVVEIIDLKSKHTIHLTAGDYNIELAEAGKEKLKLSTDKFTLTRGGQKIVTVARTPVATANGNAKPPQTTPAPKIGELRFFPGHENVVSSVVFSADGKQAVSGSWDKTVRLWDVATGKELARFDGHTETVRAVAISPDGKRIVSGGGDQVIRLWDVAGKKELRSFPGHTNLVSSLVYAPEGRRILSGSWDRTMYLRDAVNGKPVAYFQRDDMGPIESVALSPRDPLLLCGSRDRFVHVWNIDRQEYVRHWEGHDGIVQAVVFSGDGKQAASAGSDRTVRIWDVDKGKELHRFLHPDAVQSVAFSSDGKRVLSGGRDGMVRLWDVAKEKELQSFKGHKGKVWSVAISADGKYALSGGDDQTVRLWGLPPTD